MTSWGCNSCQIDRSCVMAHCHCSSDQFINCAGLASGIARESECKIFPQNRSMSAVRLSSPMVDWNSTASQPRKASDAIHSGRMRWMR